MNMSYAEIILTLTMSIMSGLATGVIASLRSKKNEKNRIEEKAKDQLTIELKDLQIQLYKLERDLNEWKDKYFSALQELIKVRSELENTMLMLNHIEIHDED